MVPADSLKNRHGRPDAVRNPHFHQDHLLLAIAPRQIPVSLELLPNDPKDVIRSLDIQKNRVHINSLIVIDTHKASPELRNNIAHLHKHACPVGQTDNKCLLHF